VVNWIENDLKKISAESLSKKKKKKMNRKIILIIIIIKWMIK